MSMRKPIKVANDFYWGGRNPKFNSKDQKIWFERMLEKKWIVPYWDIKYLHGTASSTETSPGVFKLNTTKNILKTIKIYF